MTFQILCLKQAVEKWGNSYLLNSFFFLETGTALAFFHCEGNFPFCKHDRKIVPNGLQTDSSQTFNNEKLVIW